MTSLGQPVLLCLAVTVTASLAVPSITVGAEENLAAYATAPLVPPSSGFANSVAITEISGGTYAVVANLRANLDIIGDGNWTAAMRVGVSIINVTYPAAPTTVTGTTYDADGFTHLIGGASIAVSQISGGTYAVVVSADDTGIQIINITDPSAPAIVNGTFEITNGFTHLYGAVGVEIVEIAERTYAVVAGEQDSGLQIVDITDPASPISTAAVTDGVDGFTALSGAFEVSVWSISNRTYAAVASVYDSGLQIVDITDPANPFPVVDITGITDPVSGGYTALRWMFDVTVFETSGRTYAVAASIRDNSLQIFDITDPSDPAPVIGITDDLDEFAGLTVTGIEIAEIDSRTYVVIASADYGSVQIIDITDPANPFPLPSPHSTTRPDSG